MESLPREARGAQSRDDRGCHRAGHNLALPFAAGPECLSSEPISEVRSGLGYGRLIRRAGGIRPLARYITLLFLGFHDTRFGEYVDVGLHAVAVDERRRPFVPTFWTIPKGQRPRGHVEQTWFAGVHSSVGGGYADAGLSDQALIWMIARDQALTGLEFDTAAVKDSTKPNIDGEVVNSSQGWPISQLFPYRRVILSPDAIHHGIFLNTRNLAEERINERVHWSVLAKRGRPCTYYGKPDTPYAPPNLPSNIPEQNVATITPEERAMLP
jgi:hypothetical protein